MVFGKKKEEDITMQEAIVEIGKGMKVMSEEIAELKKKKQEQPKVEEVKPKINLKQDVSNFVIFDQPTQHQRMIVDQTDKDNPIVYDIETALVKLLNEVTTLKKALA